jgi:hypothetical protein
MPHHVSIVEVAGSLCRHATKLGCPVSTEKSMTLTRKETR